MNQQATIVDTALGPVEVAVSGEGPAVLVLHGTMGGWDQAMAAARTIGAPGYRCVAVSRPGYLGTPLHLGRHPDAQSDLCAAVLDALDIGEVAVLGLSGGGPTALRFALRHPARTWGLVLISTCAGRTTTPTPPWVFRCLAQLTRWSWLSRTLQARMSRDLAGAVRMFISDPEVLERTLADPEAGPLLAQFVLGTVDRMYQRIAGTYNDIEIMGSADHALEEIAAPTLIVHGTEDTMLSYAEHARAFEARIPGAELLTIEGGEHGAVFSHREPIRTAVAAFLRDNRERTRPTKSSAN